jgi:PAS domain S-box-containing protein
MVVFFRDVSEARESAAIVRQQQELLAVVQQAARVATFNIDLTTDTMEFGPGSFEVYGWPFSELHSLESFRSKRLPQYAVPVAASVAQAIATLKPVTIEFEVIDQAGAPIWLESRFQAIKEDGKVQFLRGITIDISERKKNEATLLASEARYRALIELNPQALWIGDPEGNITYANQGFLDYMGLTQETIRGQGWLEAFDPAEHERIKAAWRHSVETGDLYDVEARLRRSSDGSYRWWNLRAKPVRNGEGALLYWLGVGNDLHDLKMQAEELRRQQEETERRRTELESVYESAPVGLALFDPVDFRYLRLNDRQAQIVGLPKDQILGRTLTEIAPIEGLREMFEQVAEGRPIRNQLLEGALVTDSPGTHRYWTVNYFPVCGPDGSVQAITAASLEITNQKRAEVALIQSEKLAAVGRLASSISHEINNPLEAVTNLLYLVNCSEELSTEVKTYVQMAQSELSRVSQIATQTLRFHRQAVSETRVTAGELIGAVLTLYQGRLSNSNIRVETRYNTATPILCFENDIRQVLNNLIANAIDAMRTGGRLVARAHEAVDARTGVRGVRLSIADTGHGMTPQVLARVFEPFYTTKDLNGTGLGLWISEGIVQRHHGHLLVRSSTHPVHHGTVFTLFLPLERVPA